MPERTADAVTALEQSNWQRLEEGLDIRKAITQDGLVVTAYRVSPANFTFDMAVQDRNNGSRAKDIGEKEGAVLAVNGGFFAETESGRLYSIGYYRLGGEVLSKGWRNSGGVVVFAEDGPELVPSHNGIPINDFNVLQTKPMIIEPGGKWAMGSNLGQFKHRTMLCRLANGDIVFVLVTRSGMSLYEAGWMLRSSQDGGFFNCDAAVALDGGRSTQVWYSGQPAYSYSGLTPVHNFIVVRQREN
ncbi:MAG: phosphodiester glycosidase family protein [Pseudomonadota bacterium]